MAYPAGTPVKESILANVVTTLQGITGSPNYHHTIRSVKRLDVDNPFVAFDSQEFPAIILSYAEVTRDDSTHGVIRGEIGQSAIAVLSNRESYATELEWLIADIHRALLSTYTRGGYAFDTKITGEQVLEPEEVAGLAAVQITFRMRFGHAYDDPNTVL